MTEPNLDIETTHIRARQGVETYIDVLPPYGPSTDAQLTITFSGPAPLLQRIREAIEQRDFILRNATPQPQGQV